MGGAPYRGLGALAAAGVFLALQPAWAAASATASPAEYRGRLQQAAALARACSSAAPACDASKTGGDLSIQAGQSGRSGQPGGYTLRLDWLRAALTQAHAAAPGERARLMAEASARIDRELAYLDAPPAPDTRARAQANAILSRREFRSADEGPGWWQMLLARFWAWLDRVLFNAANASAHRPWIGLTVEWTLLGGAIAGLLAYVFRALGKDRGSRAELWKPRFTHAEEAEGDWAALAEAAAAAGDWRAAVHALYWASVGSLAASGRWRKRSPDAETRTPREYLGLLEPESPQRGTLAALTALLERVWYARREAGERDYQRARELATALGVPLSRPTGFGRLAGAGL